MTMMMIILVIDNHDINDDCLMMILIWPASPLPTFCPYLSDEATDNYHKEMIYGDDDDCDFDDDDYDDFDDDFDPITLSAANFLSSLV